MADGAQDLPPAEDPLATIAAWRERDAQRVHPVRFRALEALARRAQAHGGATRRLLDDMLARRVAAYRADLEAAHADKTAAADRHSPAPAAVTRGPLADLLDHLARQASPNAQPDSAAGATGLAELKAMSHFRATWDRLSAAQRLTQSLAKVPDNAGPLNSLQLVHRSLALMSELSPEYLHRFLAHVDALLWLEAASGDSPRAAPRR